MIRGIRRDNNPNNHFKKQLNVSFKESKRRKIILKKAQESCKNHEEQMLRDRKTEIVSVNNFNDDI